MIGPRRVCLRCLRSDCEHLMPQPAYLTERDIEVIRLLGAGYSNKQIGDHLGLTEGTIKVYVNRIFDKIGTDNRVQLALWARDHADVVRRTA
jgi:DNA-binding NarL/FixJ family response regulator